MRLSGVLVLVFKILLFYKLPDWTICTVKPANHLRLVLGHIQTKPELFLYDNFPHSPQTQCFLKKLLHTYKTSETDQNDVVYIPHQYVTL